MTDVLDPANPFARPSALPWQLPDFAAIRGEHILEAAQAGMAEQLAEVEAIATDPAPPSLENTVVALERSGALLNRTLAVFHNLIASDGTPELAEIHSALAPQLAAHTDAIHLDPRLFARLRALVEQIEGLALEADQRRLLETTYRIFQRAGAGLDETGHVHLRAINAELATLEARFEQLLLDDTNARAVHLLERAELDGLSASDIDAAAEAARSRGLDGYVITLSLPSNPPELDLLTRRDVRRRLYEASVGRGSSGGDFDTRAVVLRQVQLRAQRAELLGYANHAEYVVANGTAKALTAVDEMFELVIAPAMRRANAEAKELEAALLADGQSAPLQPWDWAFYARRLRDASLGVDSDALRPYFELDNLVRDGIFYAAQQLYGVSFAIREDLRGYHPDVRVYEAHAQDGTPCGLFLADWYTRDSKQGGAWMSSFVDQSHLLGHGPVIVINLNLRKPVGAEPTLLSLDEVNTAFHEFGHVLHGLLSNVRYPSQSGTNVATDFVEFPSQVNELWAYDPEVLRRYARHVHTGEAMPQAWVDLIESASRFGQGFATTEYAAAALLDLAWHRLSAAQASALSVDDVLSFEANALRDSGIAHSLIPPRYRTPYFRHIFGGQYSANYYAYLWAEILDADTVDWFRENGGLRRENGRLFAQELLSRGDSRDPMLDFEAVRGRGPRIEPLLRRRGLIDSPAT